MLDDGFYVIKDAICDITGDGSRNNAVGEFIVSAEVAGETIIDREIIKCYMVLQHDSAELQVYWEDYGYKAYKKLGLFGQMNSKWQPIEKLTDSSFIVTDKQGSYTVTIEYKPN